MQQAVLTGRELDEGAKVLDANDFALVDFAHFGFFDDAKDGSFRGSACSALDCGNMDRAVFLNFDGSARLVLDAADDLAARADDVANLVDRDVDGLDARRERRELRARFGDLLEHRVQDVRTAVVGLLERTGQNLDGQALGLVVHLQGRNAALGATDLEVHVAQEVFDALDVGEDDNVVALFDEAHGDAGDRTGDRHARVHQR